MCTVSTSVNVSEIVNLDFNATKRKKITYCIIILVSPTLD